MGTIKSLTFFSVKAAANFADAIPSIFIFHCSFATPGMSVGDAVSPEGGEDWVLDKSAAFSHSI